MNHLDPSDHKLTHLIFLFDLSDISQQHKHNPHSFSKHLKYDFSHHFCEFHQLQRNQHQINQINKKIKARTKKSSFFAKTNSPKQV
ncbi:hypothetical protein MtrunA17_Chr4g0009391 [Medicago truncatula]|uniref:Uncharacterized protein n=1 Tax=Medicago truncatula TaxID=3880 RepID=A0A396I2T3_MEDTR|nr:hypothetical protein MtrunA17_Chr4g0009391 [Medicago truncatula]